MLYTIHQLVDNNFMEKESFFKKYKKEIIIIIFASIALLIVLYFLFFNKNTIDTNTKNQNNTKSKFSFGDLLGIRNNGNDDKNGNGIDDDEENNDGIVFDYYFEDIIKVWDKPVAGYAYYYKPYTYKYLEEGEEKIINKTKTILQFVDSETGFIYEKDLSAPTSTPIQVTINSYPNIMRAYFLNDKEGYKSKVFMQYGEDNKIKTISANIPNNYGSATNLSNILNLQDNIKHISTSIDNKILAYILSINKTKNSKNDIYTDWYIIENTIDSYGKRIYTSELPYWKLSISNNGDIYAFNTDTAYEQNSLYKLNINKKTNLNILEQIYKDSYGVYASINKNSVIVSMFTGGGLVIYKNDNFNNTSFDKNNLEKLNFTTLANKCTQNNDSDNLIICSVPKTIKNYDSGLPDAWYQGMTSWKDSLYIVNKDYTNGSLLFDIEKDSDIKDIIDAKNLLINKSETHLGFINKNDGSLWTLNISNILNENNN